jgi:uncharacterized phage protein (TIGR02220 family)
MSLPWFRMYSEFMTDWRIEALAFEDQRHYVFLLCAKCAGFLDQNYPTEAIRDRSIGRRLGLQGEALDNAKLRLLEVGLINDEWQPVAWEKRQHASDSAAERMRKYREKQKKVDGDSSGSVTVTAALRNSDAIDTDTDTDTDKRSPNGDMSGTLRAPRRIAAEANRKEQVEAAKRVLEFLNEKTGRNYRPTSVNLDKIAARLREDYTEMQCRQVVVKKCREWMPDEKMAVYLRPATLFGREKFAQYAGELGQREVSHDFG